MVAGVGTDIVDIERIALAVAKHGQRFVQRILTASEQRHYAASSRPVAYLAKRFAAKEAASKALGTGIGVISWQHMEVVNDSQGAPELRLNGPALELLHQRGASTIWLSLSDEKHMALAFVVIS